jgi:hypothetical protein
MKKKELTAMLTVLIREALNESYGKRTYFDKYRTSKLHPTEIQRKADEKNRRQDPYDFPSLVRPSTVPAFSPEASYEIPQSVKDFLNMTLQSFSTNPVAVKILRGIPVGKSEAMTLSKIMIELPHFPFKQPRKLMNLLVLLAAENQKH